MAETVARHVVVAGRVQGVWFRHSLRREAERRSVTGWVRNLADGRVEALLEGSPSDVEALVAWCARGPRGARVAGVTSEAVPPTGVTGFEVR
ncbi:MAG TPA: acylphosphatase [Acidimicrobiales bacterium]|nr:acylphosphatase [Acidimicrobiales bacterium]